MKTCEHCHIHVNTSAVSCPLCKHGLEKNASSYPVPSNLYPDLSKEIIQYDFVMRILLFVSLLGCGISVLINLFYPTNFLWCLIVIAAVAYAWIIVPSLLRSGFNYALQSLLQSFFACGLSIALDFIIGYRGWSFAYVVPSILTVCILSVDLLSIFYPTRYSQYVLYQVIVGILGFVPMVLYLTGVSHVLILVIIPACLGLASVLACFIFGDKSLKTEFKRRFHL